MSEKLYRIKPLEFERKDLTDGKMRYYNYLIDAQIIKEEQGVYKVEYSVDEYKTDGTCCSTFKEAKAWLTEIYREYVSQFLEEVTE